MIQYLDLLRHIKDNGVEKEDRTGVGTLSMFGHQMRFDLHDGFPLVTTKKVYWKGVVVELLWFLRGETNTKFLNDNGVSIWDEWADSSGNLGPIYGHQWRAWRTAEGKTVDQITSVINQIRQDPDSRRLIVNSWNVGQLDQMALPPCHMMFQFYVADGRLSCQLYQRSADVFLGVVWNIASYALLTHLVAAQTDLDVGEFIWTGGDCHIYKNHLEQVEEQLLRAPHPLPRISIRKRDSIFDYTYEDISLEDYVYHPPIKAPVAV